MHFPSKYKLFFARETMGMASGRIPPGSKELTELG